MASPTPHTQAPLDVPQALDRIRADRTRRLVGALLTMGALITATFVGEALVLAQDRTPVQTRAYDPQPGQLAPYQADPGE